MFTAIWLIFLAFFISSSIIWVIDHRGFMIINWLGYEVRAEIITAIIIAITFTVAIFLIAYFITKILALKFPNLLKIFFKKTYLRNLERLIIRHQQGFETLTKLLLAIEAKDNNSEELQKKFNRLIKNRDLNNLLKGKIALNSDQFYTAESLFKKISHHNNTQNLICHSKFRIAQIENDYQSAIAFANQILESTPDNIAVAKELFFIYKKLGYWQEAKSLINRVGVDKFRDELEQRELLITKTAIAFQLYKNKKFYHSLRETRKVLNISPSFLPAIEIGLKSLIRLSFNFLAIMQIKKLWQERPNLIFIDIFYLAHRKLDKRKRLEAVKNLVSKNSSNIEKNFYLNDLAIAQIAFRISDFNNAKIFANKALEKEPNFYSYQILANIARIEGDIAEYNKNNEKSKYFNPQFQYVCENCETTSSSWSIECMKCRSHDSLIWNG